MSEQPLESVIETYLKDQIKAIGGLTYKFLSTVRGVPDQIVIYNGGIYFLEVKRPGEKPRKSQVTVHESIRERDVEVYIIDTQAAVRAFIRDVLEAEPARQPNKAKSSTDDIVIRDAFKALKR